MGHEIASRSAIVLHTLRAASDLGTEPLGRTALVKAVFLAEQLRTIYGVWTSVGQFVKYKHGPYDEQVIARAEALVFNGLATIELYIREHRRTNAAYSITGAGKRVQAKLRDIHGATLYDLAVDIQMCLQAFGVASASQLCGVVYQDPDFAEVFRTTSPDVASLNSAAPIRGVSASGRSSTLLRQMIIANEWKERTGSWPSPRQQVFAYVNSLVITAAGREIDRGL